MHDLQRIHAQLHALPVIQRLVVELRCGFFYDHRCPVNECAEILGISEESVTRNYDAALRTLRTRPRRNGWLQ